STLLASTFFFLFHDPPPTGFSPLSLHDALPISAAVGISGVDYLVAETGTVVLAARPEEPRSLSLLPPVHIAVAERRQLLPDLFEDRKSTRLNSSHVSISYAVFCLKKKKKSKVSR